MPTYIPAPAVSNEKLDLINKLRNNNVIIDINVPAETEETIQKMLRFSFSRALNSHTSFVRLLTQSFCIAVKYFSSKPQTVWTMRAVLNYISTHINFRVLSVNRKNEELLAFETIAMYAFMQTDDAKKISISMEDFDQKYPEFTAP
jgi:hypothetical protein